MSTNWRSSLSRGLIFSLAVLVSASSSAWHAGYYHGGGDYYRPGSYYHGGSWGGPAVTIGIPFGGGYGASYYGPSCFNQRVCNYSGCWLQQVCN